MNSIRRYISVFIEQFRPVLMLPVVIILIFSACSENSDSKTLVEEGILKPLNTNMLTQGFLRLEGRWQFLSAEADTPETAGNYNESRWQTIQVPGSWNRITGQGQGQVWYRCRVILPEKISAKEAGSLGIHISGAYTSYRLFVNGIETASAGKPGKTADETIPMLLTGSIPSGLKESVSEIEILIQISNFHHSRGGLRDTPLFGNYSKISRFQWTKDIIDFTIIGILLMMAAYQLLFWLGRRENLPLLFFSLCCIIICFRVIARNNYIERIFPEYDLFEIRYLIEYLAITAGWVSFTQFFRRLYPEEFNPVITYFFLATGILFSLFIICTPCITYSAHINYVYILLILACLWIIFSTVLSIIRKRTGAILILAGFFIFTISIINDILFSKSYVFTGHVAHIGLTFMIFTQSIVISRRYRSALELQVRNKELRKELSTARLIQQKLLPDSAPLTERFNIHMTYVPMDMVGGDFYDYNIKDDATTLFIADVSGHGLASAFISLITKSALTNNSGSHEPVEIMSYLNRVVRESTVNNNFVTAFYCSIDHHSGIMRYSRAGHPPALLYSRNRNSIKELTAGGAALGMADIFTGEEKSIQLEKGDRIILYTDGITECMSPEGVLYGTEALYKFIAESIYSPPDIVSRDLLDDLKKHAGSAGFNDDITLIVIDILHHNIKDQI